MFELGPKGQEENPPYTAEPETKRKTKNLKKRGVGGEKMCVKFTKMATGEDACGLGQPKQASE